MSEPADWFLTVDERGNSATEIDRRRDDGLAWTTGNEVTPLVHGAVYFTELLAALDGMSPGDLVMFTDWRGDPDQRLGADDPSIGHILAEACRRGVDVRGLMWRSHLDKLRFSADENRHLGEEVCGAGGQVLLDMRVRPGGSHHQKLVILRHPGRSERDVAYVGGIDLCHSRRDDRHHHGDAQAQTISPEYGDRPPWHDVHLAVRGPAVGDFEATFRERWADPAPLSRNPFHQLKDRIRGDNQSWTPLPPQLPDPAPRGPHAVQVLRTYPYRRWAYPFAPLGERSAARGIAKALRGARDLIYVEDQYLWSEEVAAPFAEALAANPELRMIAIVPAHPDETGLVRDGQDTGRRRALSALRQAGGDRVAVYGLENAAATPIYVHAKVTIIDDVWSKVGSDNLNIRSWTHDSEISCAVLDDSREGVPFARDLRLTLAREHLGLDDDEKVTDVWDAFRAAADALDAWVAAGRQGPRPPGQLRNYVTPTVRPSRRSLASACYRWICDPDGRKRGNRQSGF